MYISKAEAHSRAVISIQALLSKHRPGTISHCIAELALDLAFNGFIPTNADFELELLAHARLLIRKQIAARLRPNLQAAPRSRYFPTFDVVPGVMRSFASRQLKTKFFTTGPAYVCRG
jgi:hypothetical protein